MSTNNFGAPIKGIKDATGTLHKIDYNEGLQNQVGKKNANELGEIFGDYEHNSADSNFSEAHGKGTLATGEEGKFVCGRYNSDSTNTIFEVGNGDIDNELTSFEVGYSEELGGHYARGINMYDQYGKLYGGPARGDRLGQVSATWADANKQQTIYVNQNGYLFVPNYYGNILTLKKHRYKKRSADGTTVGSKLKIYVDYSQVKLPENVKKVFGTSREDLSNKIKFYLKPRLLFKQRGTGHRWQQLNNNPLIANWKKKMGETVTIQTYPYMQSIGWGCAIYDALKVNQEGYELRQQSGTSNRYKPKFANLTIGDTGVLSNDFVNFNIESLLYPDKIDVAFNVFQDSKMNFKVQSLKSTEIPYKEEKYYLPLIKPITGIQSYDENLTVSFANLIANSSRRSGIKTNGRNLKFSYDLYCDITNEANNILIAKNCNVLEIGLNSAYWKVQDNPVFIEKSNGEVRAPEFSLYTKIL